MTDEYLKEIEGRVDATTEGKWKADEGDDGVSVIYPANHDEQVIGRINKWPDAKFIAWARDDVRALIDEVRRLREQKR